MAEGGGPPSDERWEKMRGHLLKESAALRKQHARRQAQKPPSDWRSDYPRRLDSLDTFFSKEAGKSIHKGKLIDRPRTKAQRDVAELSEKDKKLRMMRMSLKEAVDEMTKVTDEICSALDDILKSSKGWDKYTLEDKMFNVIDLTEDILAIYRDTRCGVPSQYFVLQVKLKAQLLKASIAKFSRLNEQLLYAYDILNSIRELHGRTKFNARELERNYLEKRVQKQKLRSPLPPHERPPVGLPPAPPPKKSKKKRFKHQKEAQKRRDRAQKPKSSLALVSTPPERSPPPEEESPPSSPTEEESPPSSSSPSVTDLGATASSVLSSGADLGATGSTKPSSPTKPLSPKNPTPRKNCVLRAIAKAKASIAKFARRRELLQSGASGLPEIEKLSILPFDEADESIDDLCRDSDDDIDMTDDESSDED